MGSARLFQSSGYLIFELPQFLLEQFLIQRQHILISRPFLTYHSMTRGNFFLQLSARSVTTKASAADWLALSRFAILVLDVLATITISGTPPTSHSAEKLMIPT